MIHRESRLMPARKKQVVSVKSMGTFAPAYLRAANERVVDPAVEAEFGEKKWVWVKDEVLGFQKAWIISEEADTLRVRCPDDKDKTVQRHETDKVNPPKFDNIQDMASLTYLNEPSVAHNLQQRHGNGDIYTYSGLFLVAVNPYRALSIYRKDNIESFQHRSRDEVAKPHVFGTSDLAFRNMLEMRENQSILVTGESGAGKTENTKRVIQYLAAIASKSSSKEAHGNLEQQIIQANPILEAFGNAQTVRNDNSSRFGKFIRIQFNEQGQITGAHINWFLLEKSRVVKQSAQERNYHIFYQLLAGAASEMRDELLLHGDFREYAYLRESRGALPGVSDNEMFKQLTTSFQIMHFSSAEQMQFFRIIAVILHIGNINVAADRADQARISDMTQVEKVCHLLGLSTKDFTRALLSPRVKAGREWVTSARSAAQVKISLAALARTLYERNFGALVDRINETTEQRASSSSSFIGVLDMAGFEIFQKNSFEQLCINYTNEKLQQFFNHHMFVLEQEEYAREQIEWKFMDFGLDLQPTIELIEKSNPIGILSCLDEESVMPKATDVTFTEKLHHLWKDRSNKYRTARFPKDGFVLTHYAADVEYSTEGWLEKNKDPLNENVMQLLAQSNVQFVARLFADSGLEDGGKVKKGLFRTVAQRHKEHLSSLMTQLNSTQPHFIRCIIPNHEKSSTKFDFALVLDQLRCNGVLEGIRIARTGFPNRLDFIEFKQRYGILAQDLPKGYIEGQKITQLILTSIQLDPAYFRIGLTKVFFRAGVLAELEERRESLLKEMIVRIQAISSGYLRRRLVFKRLHRKDATVLLKNDFKIYLKLSQSPWWQLFMKMKPVLSATKSDREIKMRSAEVLKLEALAKSREEASLLAMEKMHKAELARRELEEVLLAERNTASDKEDLYVRSCERETLLKEDLDLALADVDNLENRCDELLATKRDLETQIDMLRSNMDHGTLIAERLQSEKLALVASLGTVEDRMKAQLERQSELEAMKATNNATLEHLRAQLAASETALADLKIKYDVEVTQRTQMTSRTSSQVDQLQSDLEKVVLERNAVRAQLDEMISSTSMSELLIRKKDNELAELHNSLSVYKDKDDKEQDMLSKQVLEIASLKARVQDTEVVLKSLKADKLSLEEELSILRDGRGTSGNIASLEQQILDLRRKLDEARQVQTSETLASRLALDAQSREAEEYRLAVQKLEVVNGGLVKQIAKSMQEKLELKEELRRVNDVRGDLTSQRDDLKIRIARTDSESNSVDTVREELQKQLQESQARVKAALAKASLVDVEKERFRREAMDMRAKLENLRLQRHAGDGNNRQHDLELAAAHNKLKDLQTDYESIKTELGKSRAKLDHVNRMDTDLVAIQVRDVMQQKDALELQLSNARTEKSKTEEELLKLSSNRSRLSKELEDLNHELDKEHRLAKAAEQTALKLQNSLAESRANLDNEKEHSNTARTLVRKLEASLKAATQELNERTDQVLSLHQAVTEDQRGIASYEQVKIDKSVDLAKQLNAARSALRKAEASKASLETQLLDTKQRHTELADFEAKHSKYKSRADSVSTLDIGHTPSKSTRPMSAPWTPPQTTRSTFETPGRSRTNTLAQNFEDRSLQTHDALKLEASNRKVRALQTEVELLRGQLTKSTHLSGGNAASGNNTSEQDTDSSSVKRLTRENKRLHELLDDNADQVTAIENAQRRDRESLRDMQNKSMAEIESTFSTLADEKLALTRAQRKSRIELEAANAELETTRQSRSQLEKTLASLQKELQEHLKDTSDDPSIVAQLEDDLTDAQLRAEAESIRAQELDDSVRMYKRRAEEYFDRLEQAETTVMRAKQSENSTKIQLRENEEALKAALQDRQSQDSFIISMQKQIQEMELKLEDGSLELSAVSTQRARLQHELEQYRSIKGQEFEELDANAEQTRKAYQREMVSLSNELETERTNAIKLREDNRAVRSEIEDLRSKRTDDQMKAATLEKESSRKDNKLRDLANDLRASETSQRESQSRIVTMLSEIRELRIAKEELALEKEEIAKQKSALESKLRSVSQSLNDTKTASHVRVPSSPKRELAAALAEKDDELLVMSEKMHAADVAVASAQRDVLQEREANVSLHKQKVALENEKKEMQLRMVDLETKSFTSSAKDIKFLQTRISELERELQGQDRAKLAESRSSMNTERTIKELESTLTQRLAAQKRLEEKAAKSDSRLQIMQADLESVRDADAASQLRARRAERDASDQRERALRAEKELERYRNREELSKLSRTNTINRLSGSLHTLKSEPNLALRTTYSPAR